MAVVSAKKPVERMMGQNSTVQHDVKYVERGEFTCGNETAIYIPTSLKRIQHANVFPRTAASYAKEIFSDLAIADHAPSDTTNWGEAAIPTIKIEATAGVSGSFTYELIGDQY